MNQITEFCRQLRNNPTPAEKTLWAAIRRRNVSGEKFLRQFPIFIVQGIGRKDFYIADFYCAAYKLVIEVDGPIHLLKKEYDDNRDLAMQEWGFSVLRFTNDEVTKDLDKVISIINSYILLHNEAGHFIKRKSRAGWAEQLKESINQFDYPDDELL